MVALKDVQFSNSKISSTFPTGLVAVFVGATSGIGEFTLLQFAKDVPKAHVYFVGRSQEAADRIKGECQAVNPEGKFEFIKSDVSLIKNVDDVCRIIMSKEKVINLLFQTQGTLDFSTYTSEGIRLASALPLYSRNRFTANLLPLIQAAPDFRRVVSVFTATKEGPVFSDDYERKDIPLMKARGHGSSLVTLSMESYAARAPTVTFIHNYPGAVKTGIDRGMTGPMMTVAKWGFKILMPFMAVPRQETGERHLFLATSARWPAKETEKSTAGVVLEGDVGIAVGSDGKKGSGSYSVDENGESAGPEVLKVLAKCRADGEKEKLWKHCEEKFVEITGSAAI